MATPDADARGILRAPDPRTARTRAAILTGLANLLREGRSDATVRDVVAAAGVSRASFYVHFRGVDDVSAALLEAAFDDLRTQYLAERTRLGRRTAQSVRAGQERLADAFWEQRALLCSLMDSSTSGPAYMGIVRGFAATIAAILDSEQDRVPAGIDPQVASVAVSNTLVGILTAWVSGEIDADRDTVVDHLVAMLPAWMAQPDSPDLEPEEG